MANSDILKLSEDGKTVIGVYDVDITYKAKNLYDSQVELINRLSESERQLVLDYAAGLEQDKGNVKVYPK